MYTQHFLHHKESNYLNKETPSKREANSKVELF